MVLTPDPAGAALNPFGMPTFLHPIGHPPLAAAARVEGASEKVCTSKGDTIYYIYIYLYVNVYIILILLTFDKQTYIYIYTYLSIYFSLKRQDQ